MNKIKIVVYSLADESHDMRSWSGTAEFPLSMVSRWQYQGLLHPCMTDDRGVSFQFMQENGRLRFLVPLADASALRHEQIPNTTAIVEAGDEVLLRLLAATAEVEIIG